MSSERPAAEVCESVDFDERVREQDPFLLDDFFSTRFRALNDAGDTAGLTEEAVAISEMVDFFLDAPYTREQLYAAHRDFCFFTTALGTKGVDIEAYLEIRKAAKRLMEATGEGPRDSVYTYMFRNPSDERMRTFTSNPSERSLIRGFQMGMEYLFFAIEKAELLATTPENSPQYAALCTDIISGLEGMVAGIREAKKIPPEVFMQVLRPYADAISFEGKDYVGPGGAQIPVYLVDLMLWSSDLPDEWYAPYALHSADGGPPVYRELTKELVGKPSALTRLIKGYEAGGATEEAAQALRKCLLFLRKFRLTHFNLAKSTFALREEGSVGSSGSPVTILEQINGALEHAINRAPGASGEVVPLRESPPAE